MTQIISPMRALLHVEASASVPRLSNAQMLDAPQNSAIRDIWLLPPDNPKIVAAICHGPWVLSDAGLTRGKRATGWWSIKPDLENAGATFIDEPAVTDGKIVTARAPIDLAAFVQAIDDLLVAA